MGTFTDTRTTKYYVHECIDCGVPFAFSDALDDCFRENHNTFYCPNGHTQHYPDKNDLEREKERAAALEKQLTRESQRRIAAERSAAAQKGHTTRLKKRISNGVCPCCNRHFVDLDRHMGTKHPDYAE